MRGPRFAEVSEGLGEVRLSSRVLDLVLGLGLGLGLLVGGLVVRCSS